jgi:hypothetical protein
MKGEEEFDMLTKEYPEVTKVVEDFPCLNPGADPEVTVTLLLFLFSLFAFGFAVFHS